MCDPRALEAALSCSSASPARAAVGPVRACSFTPLGTVSDKEPFSELGGMDRQERFGTDGFMLNQCAPQGMLSNASLSLMEDVALARMWHWPGRSVRGRSFFLQTEFGQGRIAWDERRGYSVVPVDTC